MTPRSQQDSSPSPTPADHPGRAVVVAGRLAREDGCDGAAFGALDAVRLLLEETAEAAQARESPALEILDRPRRRGVIQVFREPGGVVPGEIGHERAPALSELVCEAVESTVAHALADGAGDARQGLARLQVSGQDRDVRAQASKRLGPFAAGPSRQAAVPPGVLHEIGKQRRPAWPPLPAPPKAPSVPASPGAHSRSRAHTTNAVSDSWPSSSCACHSSVAEGVRVPRCSDSSQCNGRAVRRDHDAVCFQRFGGAALVRTPPRTQLQERRRNPGCALRLPPSALRRARQAAWGSTWCRIRDPGGRESAGRCVTPVPRPLIPDPRSLIRIPTRVRSPEGGFP